MAVAAAFHRVPAAAPQPAAIDLCSCRSRSGPALSLRRQRGALASEKRGTGGGSGKEEGIWAYECCRSLVEHLSLNSGNHCNLMMPNTKRGSWKRSAAV